MDDILPDPTTEETIDGLKGDDLAVPVGKASDGSAACDRFVAQPVTQPVGANVTAFAQERSQCDLHRTRLLLVRSGRELGHIGDARLSKEQR